jgi:1-acylglycerone phosphate reductase
MSSRVTVLITGCSDDGIGSALAAEFRKRGYHVFATARIFSKMSKLQNLLNVALLQLDVIDPEHVKAAVEAVAKVTGGNLNYLINNAGQSHFMPILDEDIDAVKALFDVNLYGPIALTRAFAPLVIKAKSTFAFTTSVAGYVNIFWMGTHQFPKSHKSPETQT